MLRKPGTGVTRKLLLIVGLCVLLSNAKAQVRFDQWTADAGLPQNSVYAIVQTRDSYVWLATLDGLVRFDGVRFAVFNKSNSPGINNNRFVYLYEDVQGDLWAGTEQSGVVRLHQGRFTSYGLEQGLSSLRIVWLTGDVSGNVLVYFPGMLRTVRWSGERFEPSDNAPVYPPVVPSPPRENQTVFCQKDPTHVGCFVNGRYETFLYSNGFPNFQLTFFYNSAQDTTGALWIATADAGLLKIENGKVVRAYAKSDGVPDFPIRMVTGAHVSLLSKDKQGALWLTDTEKMQSLLLTRTPPDSLLLSDEVRAAFEDNEGNIWFGTSRGGLFRIRKQFITAYSKAEGLTDNNIYPIYQASDGVVWIGAPKGLFKYQHEIFTPEKAIEPQNVAAIAEDRSGRLLIGGQDVRVLDRTRANVIFDGRPQIRIVYAIYAQPDGTLWIGGQGGLARLKDGNTTFYSARDGLTGDEVKVIIDDQNDGIWIGAYGGLMHYKDGQFTSWTEKDGLPSHTIRSLYQDGDGVLWIGTYDGGLARFKDGKFTRYDTKVGLYNDGVFQILEDAQRHFWISCNHGIYRVSKDELNDFAAGRRSAITSVAYGKSDGMLNVECNGGRSPAGIKTRDGKLWFPTQDGIAVIDPGKVTINSKPPPVVIESFLLDGTPVSTDGGVKIQPNQETFEIQYTALSFINSENLRFKYRLEELDADWVDAGTRRTAYYSHVPAGKYNFRVIAANRDGIWNEQGKSLQITVLAPFYRTWWFRALAGLLFFGLVYRAVRFRLNQVESARKVQEEFSRKLLASQEQERQRIAAELHDSIGQSLAIIRNLALVGLSEREDQAQAIEQLQEVSDAAAEALAEVKTISHNLRPYQLDRLGLSKAIVATVKAVADASEIRFSSEIAELEGCLSKEAEINLYRIVQEGLHNIVEHSAATEATVIVKRDSHNVQTEIRDNGKGFRLLSHESPAAGMGLISIAERAKIVGARCEIRSAPGEGTVISINVPLGEARK